MNAISVPQSREAFVRDLEERAEALKKSLAERPNGPERAAHDAEIANRYEDLFLSLVKAPPGARDYAHSVLVQCAQVTASITATISALTFWSGGGWGPRAMLRFVEKWADFHKIADLAANNKVIAAIVAVSVAEEAYRNVVAVGRRVESRQQAGTLGSQRDAEATARGILGNAPATAHEIYTGRCLAALSAVGS